jgi:hypothetical protein
MPTIEEEQAAFDSQLDELLKTYPGKYVLFKDGKPVEFFDDHESAYNAGLEKFGLDGPFLVAPVEKVSPQPVSVSWDAGVMFG